MLLACTVGSQHGQGVQYWAMGADGTRKATERRSEVNDKPVRVPEQAVGLFLLEQGLRLSKHSTNTQVPSSTPLPIQSSLPTKEPYHTPELLSNKSLLSL